MVQRSQVTVTWAGVEGAQPVEFAYLEDGPPDGPLALCLHGFPDHAPTWTSLLGDLAAAGFHAVAPWMRGYAPTAVPGDGLYQTGALALDALALADALSPAPADNAAGGVGGQGAVLVGHDWGAMAAYAAVVHRPGRFRRLVTMSVPHRAALGARFFTNPAQLKRSWYMFFFQLPLAGMAVSFNDYALIDKLWRDWSPGFEAPPGHLQGIKETLASPGSLDAALDFYRHLWTTTRHDPRRADAEAAASGWVPVPSLYLHGADDGCIGPELVVADELKPLFPAGLDVDVLAGVGHFLHLEDPARVNRRIVGFLTAEG